MIRRALRKHLRLWSALHVVVKSTQLEAGKLTIGAVRSGIMS
jgi:hypothetical protein